MGSPARRSGTTKDALPIVLGAALLLAVPLLAPPSLFDRVHTSAYVLFVVFCASVLHGIRRARQGADLYMRPIAGLKAVDEAIGRAAEMGRKIIYVPGIGDVAEMMTVASLAVLGYVAKQTARLGVDLDVPNREALTFAAARETVKQAYLESGRPDAYRETIVNYPTFDQMAYAATVTGRMLRERPAANFFVGSFKAEALILAEVGQSSGAMQIAATAEVSQVPFFVCTCDYTLIGEEFYAASAYLSRDPVLLGCVKGQDWVKLLAIGWLIVGAVSLAAGYDIFVKLLVSK